MARSPYGNWPRPGRGRPVGLFAIGLGLALARPALGSPLDAADAVDPGARDRWLGPLLPTALYMPAEPPTSGRGPWLAVGGGVTSSPGERRRIFGVIELGIPLDDLALDAGVGTRTPVEASNGAHEDGDGEEAARDASALRAVRSAPEVSREVELAELGAEARGLGEHGRSDAGVGAGASPIRRASLRRSLDVDTAPAGGQASEPRLEAAGPRREARAVGTVPAAALPPRLGPCGDAARSCDPAAFARLARAAVAEALRVQGGGAELRRLDGMAARSRASASLPEVRLGAGTSRDESLRLTPTAADPARFTRDGGRDLWLEARLTWRLDSAIFARDEIAIMRLRAQQREETARLGAEVIDAVVAFERARAKLSSELATTDERAQALIVQFGAVARLDVLTDGWFSRQLERWPSAGRDAGWP